MDDTESGESSKDDEYDDSHQTSSTEKKNEQSPQTSSTEKNNEQRPPRQYITVDEEQQHIDGMDDAVHYSFGKCDHEKCQINDVPMDGDCMYHCVIRALNLKICVVDLRSQLADYCFDQNPTNEMLITNIRTKGIFGDDEVLSKISKFLNIDICVHYIEEVQYSQYVTQLAVNKIHLFYTISPLHYQWLDPTIIAVSEEGSSQLTVEREDRTESIIQPIVPAVRTTIREELNDLPPSQNRTSSEASNADVNTDEQGRVNCKIDE